MTTSHKIEFTIERVGHEYHARVNGIDALFSGKSEEAGAARLLEWLAEQFAARAKVKARNPDSIPPRIEQEIERRAEVIMYNINPNLKL